MNAKFLFFGVILFGASASVAQEARAILKRSYKQCQSIKKGHYEMTKFMKYMSEADTVKSTFSCDFKKLKKDTLFPSAFHYTYVKYHSGSTTKGERLYTGDALLNANLRDSTCNVVSVKKSANFISRIKHNLTFYDPFVDEKSFPFPNKEDYKDDQTHFELIGETTVGKTPCYHVQTTSFPEIDSADMLQILKMECHFWINKTDNLPMQYSAAYDMYMDQDTMYQYEKVVLDKFELGHLKDPASLTLGSIPDFYKIKDYVPHKRPELLAKDSLAPLWELPSLTDDTISLSDMKGKLVLLDFFYKACYPCMLALPSLQALHEKYEDQGLRIIGVDPYDKIEDSIAPFLAKRGVTYLVLLEGKKVAIDYHVSAYPTMYLIDRNGKILFSQMGYGEETEKKLEKIILEHL